jgi:hypothetical protein
MAIPHALEENNTKWDAWPVQNDVQAQEPNPPQADMDIDGAAEQESFSFDLSSSTAQYLRAHGPDIILTLKGV